MKVLSVIKDKQYLDALTTKLTVHYVADVDDMVQMLIVNINNFTCMKGDKVNLEAHDK